METQSTAYGATAAKPQVGGGALTSLREFLAYKLGAEEYGIDIPAQDILSYEESTRIANAPPFINPSNFVRCPSSTRRSSHTTCWPSARSTSAC